MANGANYGSHSSKGGRIRKTPRQEAQLCEIGGMTTDYAHKYRVKQAIEQGLVVPSAVLAEYPDLYPLHNIDGDEERPN